MIHFINTFFMFTKQLFQIFFMNMKYQWDFVIRKNQ